MIEKSLIAEYYKNKNIFVTGGSGFIGKCLIEKLLRSCPDVGNIYILLRPRKGKNVNERLETILSNALFDKVRKDCPEVLLKIIPIKGDVAELELGLSKEDRNTLIEKVNVIFHAAASVRFDDFLKEAVLNNVRSAREISELALETKDLSVLLHISTTYCNIDKKVVEEKLYPSYGYWRDAIILAEEEQESGLDALTAKYISPFPNTYTFTKLMAENCVNELCVGKIPTIIYRPSVVVSSSKEPFPGYIENYNGPVGMMLASGAGLLRVIYGKADIRNDYIPVDLTVKAMIAAVWDKANSPDSIKDLTVYNGGKNEGAPIRQGYMIDAGKRLYWDVPFERKIWFPGSIITSCFYQFYLYVILRHLIPAIFLDLLLGVTGQKPMFLKIHRKIYVANMAISYFMFNEWVFINDKHLALNKKVKTDIDQELFGFKDHTLMTKEDFYNFCMVSGKMAKHLLLKESLETKPETLVFTKRMYYLHIFAKTIFRIGIAYLVFYKFNILNILGRGVQEYWGSL